MSITKRIFFGAAASWFSRGLTIVLGLVLMPVLFRTLPKEELGLWLLLGQSASVLGVLDFGFGVTLTRRLAFARGKSGANPNAALTSESRSEIADLVATGLRIYRILALLATLISLGLGFLYLRSLDLESVSLSAVWTAWAVLCLSYGLNFWAAPWTCLLQGVGHVGWDAILSSFSGALTLIVQIVAALLGGGLVSLALIAAAGAVVQRIVILRFARHKQPDLFALRGQWRGDWFREMAPFAWRAWLTALGTVILFNTDQFFVATLTGTEQFPPYRAGTLVFMNLNMIAVTMATTSTVFVSQLWQLGDINAIQAIVLRNARFGLFVIAVGGAYLLTVGEPFFHLWLGEHGFPGTSILLILFLLILFETQHFIASAAIRATHLEPFAVWSILSGITKLALSWILASRLGLIGIPLGTLVAQIATNYWYSIYQLLKRLNLSSFRYFTHVVIPFLVLFISTALICEFLTWKKLNLPPSLIAIGGAIAAVCLGAFSIWICLFDTAQRLRLRESLFSRLAHRGA